MPAAPARLLVLTHHFTHGHGGTPESVRLLAELAARVSTIELDVLCAEGFFTNVARFADLPREPGQPVKPSALPLRDYAGLFVAGPWNRMAPLLVLRARLAGLWISYAAKGGMAPIEFERTRDLKKFPYLFLVEGPMARLCHQIVYSSDLERDHFRLPAVFRPRRAAVLAEPFIGPPLADQAPPAVAREANELVLGFLAEIAPRKGLLELLRGCLELRRRRVDIPFRLVIAGQARPGSEAYMAEVEQACRDLGPQARLVGPKRGAARDAFYETIDMFVMPSRFESFGLTPLEALWHGVPALCSPHLGMLQYLSDPRPFPRFDDLSPPAIARTLEQAYEARADLAGVAAAMRGRLIDAFAGDEFVAGFLSCLMRQRAGGAALEAG